MYPYCEDVFIYTRRYLDVMQECHIDERALMRHLKSLPGCRLDAYPDGSIQIVGASAQADFCRMAQEPIGEYDERLMFGEEDYAKAKVHCGGTTYSSLMAFEERRWCVRDWLGPASQRGNSNVCVPTQQQFPRMEEYPLDALLISVAFKRRLTKPKRAKLVTALAEWRNSVRSNGVFGEGPIRWSDGAITFYKKVAQFQVDASESGQCTINWLILSLMTHAINNPIADVCFTKTPGINVTFEEHYGLSEDDRIVMQLPQIDESPASTLPIDTPDIDGTSRVPAEAQPLPDITPQHFKMLVQEPCTADSLLVTILFEQLPNDVDRDSFADTVSEWAGIGLLGGFGDGFHSVHDLVYSHDTDSAWFLCDLGLADSHIALRVLANIFDAWFQHNVTIEAVVVGGNLSVEQLAYLNQE